MVYNLAFTSFINKYLFTAQICTFCLFIFSFSTSQLQYDMIPIQDQESAVVKMYQLHSFESCSHLIRWRQRQQYRSVAQQQQQIYIVVHAVLMVILLFCFLCTRLSPSPPCETPSPFYLFLSIKVFGVSSCHIQVCGYKAISTQKYIIMRLI